MEPINDRGIRDERAQSPARCRIDAKASAVQKARRKCPCLDTVLGSHRQKIACGRAEVAQELGKGKCSAVDVRSSRRSGGRSTLKCTMRPVMGQNQKS